MPITFEQLDPTPTEMPGGNGLGALFLRGFGHYLSLEELGGVGDAGFHLSQTDTLDDVEEPSYGFGDATLSLLTEGFGPASSGVGDGDGSLFLFGLGSFGSENGLGSLHFTGTGNYQALAPELDYDAVRIDERVALNMVPTGHETAKLVSRALFAGESRERVEALLAAQSALRLSDELAAVFYDLFEEVIAFSAAGADDYTAIAAAVDNLITGGFASGFIDGVALVLEALVFGTLADAFDHELITDSVALNAAIIDTYTAMTKVVESAVFGAAANEDLTMMAVMHDTVVLSAQPDTAAEFHALINDTVLFRINLTLDSGEYIAWAINTESTGLSRYTEFPYTSFAGFGGQYYGVNAGGLYRLDGDTDAGEPINARIRLGLWDMMTRLFKQLPEVLIGYTASGDLLLQVITIDDATSQKVGAFYKLRPSMATNVRENRFTPGRGIKSVDWDFELTNVNGADFDMTAVQFRPLTTSRRVRG